ncbi:endonuclease NucS domain-containing protein [Consotaella salsifontis]|uniref:Nuclease of the RecB family n=1 Tax=Consotaella salsifontis TaxID=1365950 RepID=A0A1T4S3G6_9HYPH|nr:endonuclease NucS domain-containing protein [Consotaella salsifontis]SKA22361.1 Protein of unknown function DUF91 [Consotaella salsifontis]
MPIRNSIWTIGERPGALREGKLASEKLLEAMIVAAPDILSDQWMIVGRQEKTASGGILDLLALAPDGTLILIELKKAKTPREVVAQAIDYATWAEALDAEDLGRIYERFSGGGNLAEAFRQRFGTPLDEASLNQSHQMVIVAATLDASSERIVGYLAQRGIAINVLCFQVFETGAGQLLSRAWLIDPVETQVAAVETKATDREPWNGEYYVSFGHGESRSWDEARAHGFISAGGGTWYSGTLRLLAPGDRIWVKVPGHGFVGVGTVKGAPVPLGEFELSGEDGAMRPAAEVLTGARYHREFIDDPDRAEYFVPVEWISSVPLGQAVQEVGMFGNQNTVCAPKTPKWRHTVDRLKALFPGWDGGR